MSRSFIRISDAFIYLKRISISLTEYNAYIGYTVFLVKWRHETELVTLARK